MSNGRTKLNLKISLIGRKRMGKIYSSVKKNLGLE